MSGRSFQEVILKAGGAEQLAGQFGLSDTQANSALGALLPAIAAGLQRNNTQEGGLEDLVGALKGGHHEAYLDDPGTLANEETRLDGNAILGHLLGSKDLSRKVATRAARETGLDSSILKQILPLVAAMAMGSISKQFKQPDVGNAVISALSTGSLRRELPVKKSGLAGMLSALFGKNELSVADNADDEYSLGDLFNATSGGDLTSAVFKMVMTR